MSVPTERRLFLLAIAAGTLLRVLQLATSLGSIDAFLWSQWADLIARVGILESYRYSELMNHPPFALLVAGLTARAGAALRIEFADAFRLLQAAADIVTAVALVRIARDVRWVSGDESESRPLAAALMFFLSPAVIFISAFHCNSDPLMMMFVVLAVLSAIEGRPGWCGFLLACAVGIKIVPLVIGPLFLIAARDRGARARFLFAAVSTSALIFLPGLVVSGPVFLERVFGYTGLVRAWGIPLIGSLLTRFAHWSALETATPLLPFVMLTAIAGIWLLAARRASGEPSKLPQSITAVWLTFLFFAPGFGLQYLFWALPFAFLALPRAGALALHGMLSVYLFAVYTAWSGGWPWWYADRAKTASDVRTIVILGLTSWAVIGVMTVIATARLNRARTAQLLE